MSGTIRKVKTVPGQHSINRILQDRKKRFRLFLLICGILFIGYSLYQDGLGVKKITTNQTNSNEVVSFSQEPVTVDKKLLDLSKSKEKAKLTPQRIIIPSLEIDLPVREAKIIKGFWEVFPDVAGFGLGSAYPDEMGNQVIFAHARKGLFLPLKNFKVGQIVYVMTKEKWFSYKIEEIKEVLPSQTEVIAPTPDQVLTLYTCSGFADSKRLIVKAKRIN